MKQLRIRGWEENNGLLNFNWALIREKLKAQGKDATYKFKSKLVAIRKNIQHFTETVLK